MSTDLFATEDWFDLLRTHGLVAPQVTHRTLELPSHAGWPAPLLHVMQQQAHGEWTALSNYYTGLFAPVGDVSHVTAQEWSQTLRVVRNWSGGGVVRLQPLDAQSAWVPELARGLHMAGYRVVREPAFGNWYQPVEPGGFAQYWGGRPSALRNTVERAHRRLDRHSGWRIDIWAPSAPAGDESDGALDRLTNAYLSVYSRSWKPQEPNPSFMPAFIQLAARLGCLRLGILWLDEEPLATQLWLVYPGRSAQIFKLAHVDGQEKWSAGSVLTVAMARRSIDLDRVVELDFLSGDDAYKADWMGRRRERIALLAFDRLSRQGWFAATRHQIAGLRRQVVSAAGRIRQP